MPFISGLLSLAFFAFWIYCIVDVIQTDEVVIRNLPKIAWLLLVILVPLAGSLAWLFAGRPVPDASTGNGSFRGRDPARTPSPPSRPLGPDDSPEFLTDLESERLRKWEEDLKRREDELRRREQDES